MRHLPIFYVVLFMCCTWTLRKTGWLVLKLIWFVWSEGNESIKNLELRSWNNIISCQCFSNIIICSCYNVYTEGGDGSKTKGDVDDDFTFFLLLLLFIYKQRNVCKKAKKKLFLLDWRHTNKHELLVVSTILNKFSSHFYCFTFSCNFFLLFIYFHQNSILNILQIHKTTIAIYLYKYVPIYIKKISWH